MNSIRANSLGWKNMIAEYFCLPKMNIKLIYTTGCPPRTNIRFLLFEIKRISVYNLTTFKLTDLCI